METPNAISTKANVSDADTAPNPSPTEPGIASETATGSGSTDPATTDSALTEATIADPLIKEPKPSYVKLAMRNMVRKRGLSLWHFTLTTIGLVAFLVGLSYLTR